METNKTANDESKSEQEGHDDGNPKAIGNSNNPSVAFSEKTGKDSSYGIWRINTKKEKKKRENKEEKGKRMSAGKESKPSFRSSQLDRIIRILTNVSIPK